MNLITSKYNKILSILLHDKKKINKNVQLSVLKKQEIYDLSHGVVKNLNTINYKTSEPVTGGLHAQEIFGPIENFKCACKNKYFQRSNSICNDCGIEITNSIVRRYRIGHIALNTPILNILFYRNNFSIISYILNLKNSELLSVVYFKNFIVINNGSCSKVKLFQILNEQQLFDLINNINIINYKDIKTGLEVGSGSEAIFKCLQKIDIQKEFDTLINKFTNKTTNRLSNIKNIFDFKRIVILRNLLNSNTKPIDFVFDKYYPILPAGLRPIAKLENLGDGCFGSTDLDKHYRILCSRNNKISKIKDSVLMMKWIRRLVQKAGDSVIDNRAFNEFQTKKGIKKLKSLLENIIGKNGFIRHNLMGKRVDYSGRAVVVVDPKLKLGQVGLPISMAICLFEPYVVADMIKKFPELNIFEIIKLVKKKSKKVYPSIIDVIKHRTVIINRAPTLHKYSIQSFNVVLSKGYTINVHPLVCKGFNCDFDGDHKVVHALLDPRSEIESQIIMHSKRNLFMSTTGDVLLSCNREMTLGMFWMTTISSKKIYSNYKKRFFADSEVLLLYDSNILKIKDNIQLIYKNRIIQTNVGRVIINNFLPLGFRNYEIIFDSIFINDLTYRLADKLGIYNTIKILDVIKNKGFEFATLAGITLGMTDCLDVDKKDIFITNIESKNKKIHQSFMNYLIGVDEKKIRTSNNWLELIKILKKKLLLKLNKFEDNILILCLKSGARASLEQVFQICVFKGLFIDSNNNIIDLPVLNSLKEGLNSFQFFVSAFGSRKGTIDKALKTGVSGYISRKEVILLSENVVTSLDCGTKKFEIFYISNNLSYGKLKSNLLGRYLVNDININDEIIILKNKFINYILLNKIYSFVLNQNIKNKIMFKIRTPFSCILDINKICQKCFGLDIGFFKKIPLGDIVGINSAQALGEPGTQLTLRTFHKGGIAKVSSNIEIKVISPINGYIVFDKSKCMQKDNYFLIIYSNIILNIKSSKTNKIIKSFIFNAGSKIFFNNNDIIKKQDLIGYTSKYLYYYALKSGKISLKNIINIESHDKVFNIKNYLAISKNNKQNMIINILRGSKCIDSYIIFDKTLLFVSDSDYVHKGQLIGKFTHLQDSSQHDITGGLPTIQGLLENTLKNKDNKLLMSPFDGMFIILDDIIYIFNMTKNKFIKIKLELINMEKKVLLKWIQKNKTQYKICTFINFEKFYVLFNNFSYICKNDIIQKGNLDVNFLLDKGLDIMIIQICLRNIIYKVFENFNIFIPLKHIELLTKNLFSMCKIISVPKSIETKIFIGEKMLIKEVKKINDNLLKNNSYSELLKYNIIFSGLSNIIYNSENFLNAISYQKIIQNIIKYASKGAINKLDGVRKNYIMNENLKGGTSFIKFLDLKKRKELIINCLKSLEQILRKLKIFNLKNIDKIELENNYITIIENINNKYILSHILIIFYEYLATNIYKENIFSIIKNQSLTIFLLKKIVLLML